jgi:Polyketide cyclase / dehydrase and lipid transport
VSTPARCWVGLLLLGVLFFGGVALLRSGVYGWTIFIMFPVFLGGLASWVFRPTTGRRAAALGAFTGMAAACSLLILRLDGLVCIVMSLPLVIPLGALGGWLVYHFEPSRRPASTVAILLLLPSASMTWDARARPPVFEVRTTITIAANPEQVWRHVATIADLPQPQEWFFRAGLAYPMRARMEGAGVGATRYCEFSTGPVVEPIEVWNEPSVLRFRVTENPAPMIEWSPYAQVAPRHLHDYLISKEGQFRLTRLANNHTLLEGTTWYQHGLWPAGYWRWWSDAIIHRIHLRVLTHIRTLAEKDASDDLFKSGR